MPFKKISTGIRPSVDEMRKAMKEKQSLPHTNPLMETPPVANKETKKKNTNMGRKSVKKYTQHYSTYFTKEQEVKLKTWCEKNGISPSMAIRMAVIQLIEK